MKDEDKTKGQLINELVELRQRITELETSRTEHKRTVDVLGETNAFLENILDSSSYISIISTDLEGNVLFWNKGAENIFGYKAKEIVGQQGVDILYPDDRGTKKEVKSMLLCGSRFI